jgi:hypothetical protein
MYPILYTFFGALAGVCLVGFCAGVAIRRDEILKNPTLPGKAGVIAMWVFGIIMVTCFTLLILLPPCL